MDDIIAECPPERQILLFSATVPSWVKNVSNTHMKQPKVIDLVGDRKTPDKVSHYYIEVSKEAQRIAAIATVLRDADENSKCIIFVDTKLEASDIAYNSLFQSCK